MAASVTLASHYQIDFVSKSCDTSTEEQTWTYRVTLIGVTPQGGEISDWALKLCPSPRQTVVDYTVPTEGINVSTGSFISCFDFPPGPPDTTLNSIKWDGVNNNNVSGLYTFTLSGCFDETDISVSLKTGGGPASDTTCFFGLITGPSCAVLVPPAQVPSRGVNLNKDNIISL